MKTDYGQAWLKFYINWRFPIGLVLGAVGLINEFADAVMTTGSAGGL